MKLVFGLVAFVTSWTLQAELRCRVTSHAQGRLVNANQTGFSGFNQDYLLVIRENRMVQRFYPNLTASREFDANSDTFTEIDYPSKSYGTTTLTEYVRAIDQAVYSQVSVPTSLSRKPEARFVTTAETRSFMGLQARKHTFEGRIGITVLRSTSTNPGKPTSNAGKLDALVIVCGSIWLAQPLPGYERYASFWRQLSDKIASASQAPFRIPFLQHGGLDTFDMLNSLGPALPNEPGMPVAENATVRIVLGSASKTCTEGESMADLDVTFQWFDEPPSQDDPFHSPALLANFNHIPSPADVVTAPPPTMAPLPEDETGRPTLRRNALPEQQKSDDPPAMKRNAPARTTPKKKIQ